MKKFTLVTLLFIISSFSIKAQQLPYSSEDVKPLKIGSKIPSSLVKLAKGGEVQTESLFNRKQTILVVYRGGWCPFCNRQLSGLASIKDRLVDLGYQIVAVSPDSRSSNESQKYAKSFFIASDDSTELIRNLGIAYQAPSKYSKILKKASKGKNLSVIPAPSVFILNSSGEILFRQVSKDFKQRISEELLLSIAEDYKE